MEPDWRVFWIFGRRKDVSIHGLAWSPTGPERLLFCRAAVSIHGLAWSPTLTQRQNDQTQQFQSTGSRGARRRVRGTEDAFLTFQSTGSRGARRRKEELVRPALVVSIHGLAWSPTASSIDFTTSSSFQSTGSRGARLISEHKKTRKGLFQSTGSRGARLFTRGRSLNTQSFNPRARVEPDVTGHAPRLIRAVSIHGLAWSPTGFSEKTAEELAFQSTGSRGARPTMGRTPARHKSFNPRARVEPDRVPVPIIRPPMMFQSTGSRGARLTRGNFSVRRFAFQSTGSRGARRGVLRLVRVRESFNPRARVEPDFGSRNRKGKT